MIQRYTDIVFQNFDVHFIILISLLQLLLRHHVSFFCVCKDDDDSSSPSSNSICLGESSKIRFKRPSPTFVMKYETIDLRESTMKCILPCKELNSVLYYSITYLTKLFFFTFKRL